MAAYRALVYETPGFGDYFFSATPIREIAELNIGSRPASRKPSHAHRGPARDALELQLGPVPPHAAGLVRLRLGASRPSSRRPAPAQRKERLALLQRMYAQWPFFRTLLSNMDMVLAKSDLALASRYAELVADRKLRKSVFAMIEAEWHRTVGRADAGHRREAAAGRQRRRCSARSATASPTSTRCTTCRSS